MDNSIIFSLILVLMVVLTLFTNERKKAKRRSDVKKQESYTTIIEHNTDSINKNSELMQKILAKMNDNEPDNLTDSGTTDTRVN